ncbi:glutathione S-transferase family protein [Parasedimentitalea psychrophila]|uniref:Glutathione S-transferase family protein n=1 Tax=Parasedimentitalea psychrophila TaxID=2997337 RepID=A0A9Y2KW06_9RHOB|nr:glutathione S-transferase family protein [Parasedimentitalea psychrophila]WIY23558.1 glutathione S-transferase family protein [Parasedimentitalea psychrophila]
MIKRYRLHYAPDNASLVIRLALEELGQDYETVLVDRQAQAQRSAAYRALNPSGLIPVLETPDGPMFETAAILLWLSDRHGALAPAVDSDQRAGFLKWLFFTSNTLHADLRILFYPEHYIGTDLTQQHQLRRVQRQRLHSHLSHIDAAAAQRPSWLGGDEPSVLDLYLACQLRWMALYPQGSDRSWMVLAQYPNLQAICTKLELRASVSAARCAEGLGATPFTSPFLAKPPEGSPT